MLSRVTERPGIEPRGRGWYFNEAEVVAAGNNGNAYVRRMVSGL